MLWDLPLGFLVVPIEFCTISHSDRILCTPTFWDLSIEISARPPPAADICRDAAISFCRFLLVWDLLGILPAPQNSGRAKWGSARAHRILKSRGLGKNGIFFQESETLQMPIAAPDFCLSRAERAWDVICAIWDLHHCAEICKSACREFCFPSICLPLCPAAISNLKSEISRK